MQSVMVYGFGSYFKKNELYKDIDLVIIHQDITLPSCSMAICCKKKLIDKIPLSHITMLSHDEEKHLNFISLSQAIFIGSVRSEEILDDLERLQLAILYF